MNMRVEDVPPEPQRDYGQNNAIPCCPGSATLMGTMKLFLEYLQLE
jgi:hypothetical protein